MDDAVPVWPFCEAETPGKTTKNGDNDGVNDERVNVKQVCLS